MTMPVYTLKAAWAKLEVGDPISDLELVQLLKDLKQLVSQLEQLGPTFKLATNEVRRQLMTCESYAQAREFFYHPSSHTWYPGRKRAQAALGSVPIVVGDPIESTLRARMFGAWPWPIDQDHSE